MERRRIGGWTCGGNGGEPVREMERVCKRRRDVGVGKNKADSGNLVCVLWAWCARVLQLYSLSVRRESNVAFVVVCT